MQTMTKSEFAEHRGWSKPYISKLAKSGRLAMTPDGLVDVEATNALIAKTADPAKQLKQLKPQTVSVVRPSSGREDKRQVFVSDDGFDYLVERARREHSEANISAMKDAQLAGKLVETARVTQAITDLAMTTRAAIERIPDRIGMQLAGESDPVRVYQILEDELASVCREIAESAAAMPEKLMSTEQ